MGPRAPGDNGDKHGSLIVTLSRQSSPSFGNLCWCDSFSLVSRSSSLENGAFPEQRLTTRLEDSPKLLEGELTLELSSCF
jgi:hypothetical protein